MSIHGQRNGVEDPDEAQSTVQRNYWHILVRRRWWITLPFLALGLAGFTTARLWPVLYRSQALILVEQQKVPEQYVTPNVVSDLQYRLDSMTQQILSRTRLQGLIEGFGLYQQERARIPLDEVINAMREDIQVELVQAPGRNSQLTAFRISFWAANPRTAERVTNQLTSMFIDQNVQARTQQSVNTTNFLENQLEQAHKALMDQEQRVREYKLRYLGELPQQEQGNIQILRNLESQLQVTGAALDRAEQQKVYLESMRTEYVNMRKALALREQPAASNPEIAAVEARLSDERRVLAEKQAKFTPQHPDIIAMQKQVAQSQWLLRQLQAAETASRADAKASDEATDGASDRALFEAESRLKAIAVEIAKGQAELNRLQRRIQEVQRRIGMTPVREQELAELTRNYENSKTYYESLLQKKLGSELATNLEKRQQGEQFRILDPANLPLKPSRPNRLLIVPSGWLLGLCVGIGLTAYGEVTDTSVRGESDLSDLANAAPVLVRIPVLRCSKEVTRLKWRRGFEAVGVMLAVLLCVGSSIHTYLAG
jgi:polysaccharide chain length determinant protein (PEP-CTERM system associated)